MAEALEIYTDFYEIDPNDSIGIIRLYEKNQLLLDNKSTFKDKDDFKDFVLLLGQYVISLEKMGKYSKAVRYSDKLLNLIDLQGDEFDIDKRDFTTYWSIMTSKGRALYYLKDYKNSIPIFEELLKWDSDNDNFNNWLDASKSRQRNSIHKYLYIIASILIITEIFFGDQIGNPKVKLYMTGFGFIIFMIALINEYLVDKILKMIKKE
jgi:tetratricopeptide (TPR) repeat protein